jgi:hypothetical protein
LVPENMKRMLNDGIICLEILKKLLLWNKNHIKIFCSEIWVEIYKI